jgi:hypothetical protein
MKLSGIKQAQPQKDFKNKNPTKIERDLAHTLETLVNYHLAQEGEIILPDFTKDKPIYAGIMIKTTLPRGIVEQLAKYINKKAGQAAYIKVNPKKERNTYSLNFITDDSNSEHYLSNIDGLANKAPHLIGDFHEKKMDR